MRSQGYNKTNNRETYYVVFTMNTARNDMHSVPRAAEKYVLKYFF